MRDVLPSRKRVHKPYQGLSGRKAAEREPATVKIDTMRRPAPSPNGRNARGRFAKGNLGGPGNPYAKRVADLRAALLESVTEQDIRAVARALVKRAKEGEVPAVRELLDRLLGRTADSALDRAGPPVIHLVTGVPDAECDNHRSQS